MSEWVYDETYEPLDYAAFVYRITLPDGRYYVGKKSIWVMKAGKISRESDWRSYWGSSKEVKQLVKSIGPDQCSREIVHFCVSRGHASWLEAVALIKGDCLLDPQCLNGNVLTTFNHRVVKGYSDDTRRQRYLRDIAKLKDEAGLSDK